MAPGPIEVIHNGAATGFWLPVINYMFSLIVVWLARSVLEEATSFLACTSCFGPSKSSHLLHLLTFTPAVRYLITMVFCYYRSKDNPGLIRQINHGVCADSGSATGHYSCCWPWDECLPNPLCWSTTQPLYYTATCTDQTLQDSACQKGCSGLNSCLSKSLGGPT